MSTDPDISFAVLLKERRLCVGLTQEALAERAGLSARNIQNLERGENRPLADTIARLAAALELPPDERARFVTAATPPPRRRQASAAASHSPIAAASSASHAGATGLPQPLTTFVGREREIALILRLLDDGARLVTLTGVGGTGKTRLAVQVAHAVEARFADGVAFVDLTATRDAALAPAVLAQTLGLQEAAGRPLADHLADILRPRQLLLVLDNCEHVLGLAPLIADLLAAAPHLSVLATSRVSLRLYGEHEVRVPPLAAPDPASVSCDEERDDPHDYPAVQLFLQRARLIRPDLVSTGRGRRGRGDAPAPRPPLPGAGRGGRVGADRAGASGLAAPAGSGATQSARRFARAAGRGRGKRGVALAAALERLWARHGYARALFGQGELAFVAGDPARAVACREEALALSRRTGDQWGEAMALYNLGRTAAILQGDMARGESLLRESRELFAAIGDRWGVAAALGQLAGVAALPLLVSEMEEDGATAEAIRRAREALPLCAEVDLMLTVLGLGASMFIWSAAGQPRRAVRLWGAIEAVRERSGLAIPTPPSNRPMIESLFARLRVQLGETAFAVALAEGGALSLEEAIQEALGTVVDVQ